MTSESSEDEKAPFSVTVAGLERAPVVVTVVGGIDLATSEILKAALGGALDSRPPALLIDLRDVQFCDSTGLAALIGLNRRSVFEEFDLKFMPSKAVLRLAQRTGVATFLPFVGPDSFPYPSSAESDLQAR